MTLNTNIGCERGSIAPFFPSQNMPWDERRVSHLFRRMGFGATAAEIAAALDKDPGQVVDEIINAALDQPLPEPPVWADWKVSDYTNQEEAVLQIQYWRKQWIRDMLALGFREKLALFWHNHFVTRLDDYGCPSWMYAYHRLLRRFALGNFKDFVMEIGKTPAMLVFLNGVQNTLLSPNENYARELYELFTLGRDNGYTQNDIVETARAFTGWNGFTELCAPITFVPAYLDNRQKTIFGQSGNWDYDDVHQILFSQRSNEVAEYICGKIYRHFVSPETDTTIVQQLAAVLISNDFELAPVFRTLFKSEHFFSDANIGVLIKSPIDCLVSFVKMMNFNELSDEWAEGIWYFAAQLGQDLFNPTDVAGWPGNRSWVNNNTLTGRWQALRIYLFGLYQDYPQTLVALAKSIAGDANDPSFVTQLITDFYLINGLQTQEAYDRATLTFKIEIPENYFETGSWNLNWETVPAQVALLLDHLVRKPDFQLA